MVSSFKYISDSKPLHGYHSGLILETYTCMERQPRYTREGESIHTLHCKILVLWGINHLCPQLKLSTSDVQYMVMHFLQRLNNLSEGL